jgi:maleylpyruvate isomerase
MNTDRHPRSRGWLDQGTAVILDKVARFDDDAFDQASGLPGWSRRHLVAHLAANAEALHRLTRWAATGEPTPMYSSTEQRENDIEQGARLLPPLIRDWLHDAVTLLDAGMDALSPAMWGNPVSTAQGRTVAATEIPWMRTREVWIHAVDLNVGVGFEDFPADLVTELLADVTAVRSARGKGREVELRSADGGSWHIAGAGPMVIVSGDPADLARWVTGRGVRGLASGDSAFPELGPWL